MRSRVFNICQYEFNPVTGEDLHFCEDNIIRGLSHKTIKQWAYIAHTRDVYSEKDEADDPARKQGETKPKHWHIVLRCDSAIEVSQVANWFGVPDAFVDVPKGAGAFIDCCFYLTHMDAKQQAQGKAVYAYDEITTSPGFSIQEEMRQHKRCELEVDGVTYKDPVKYYHHMIMHHGMSLEAIKAEDITTYTEHFDDFLHYRALYINQTLATPPVRFNIYVEGKPGNGKDLICRAIARSIVDSNNIGEDVEGTDEKLFFEVGGNKVAFDGYAGQPVIIWSDCRAKDICEIFGGYERALDYFDSRPKNVALHIKFGSIVLKNAVNIINSVQPYPEFIRGLCGREDVSQAQRRLPAIVVVSMETYDLLLNKGVYEGTREYDQYFFFRGLTGGFRRLVQKCGGEKSLPYKVISADRVQPIKDSYDEGVKRLTTPQQTDDEIFEEYGYDPKTLKKNPTEPEIDIELAGNDFEPTPEEQLDGYLHSTLDGQLTLDAIAMGDNKNGDE